MRKPYMLLALLMTGAAACTTEPPVTGEGFWAVDELPQAALQPAWETDQLDTLYLSGVGFNSLPLEDGSMLIYDMKDYQHETLLNVSSDGELLRQVARRGGGPGEIRAVTGLHPAAGGGALVYDGANAKAVHFNGSLEVESEFIVENYEGRSPAGVFPGPNDSTYLVEYTSIPLQQRIENPYSDLERFMVAYTPSINRYRLVARMHESTYVPRITNGRYGGAGAMLRYASTQFVAYHPGTGTFYTHESGAGEIAEVDAAFDTLRTIPLRLRHEAFSEADMDSLKSSYDMVDWETLLDKLPERKHPVGAMELSSTGEIWLKLNYRGSTQQWLALDNDGVPRKVYHLPADIHLMHVGRDHVAASTGWYSHLARFPLGGTASSGAASE